MNLKIGDIAMPIAYYHVYKSGNYHKLPSMKQPRANHVCFAEPKGDKHKKIYVVGGRNWLMQVKAAKSLRFFKVEKI